MEEEYLFISYTSYDKNTSEVSRGSINIQLRTQAYEDFKSDINKFMLDLSNKNMKEAGSSIVVKEVHIDTMCKI